jgi:predicted metal-dependent HD superfamily phosphohydrolase
VDDLRSLWPAAFPGASAALGEELLARWAEPHRRYHTVEHLRAVLTHIEASVGHAEDPSAVRLAGWFHDAIYDPTQPGNEDAGAELARALLGGTSAPVAEVERLVRLTATHVVEDGDRNAALLCDADLAILAAPPAEYARYASAVRSEYGFVPEPLFRTGRAAILRALLAKPRLFHLEHHRDAWEARARANVEAELQTL